MKLSQLEDFLAVADKQSFRAAARAKGGTQPGLSRNIRELEQELGVVLFDRDKHGATLTAAGERFVHRARAGLAELQRGREELSQLSDGAHSTGQVVACLSAGAHARLLPDALPAFRRRYPQVHLHVMEGVYRGIEGRLKDGEIDLYAGPQPPLGIDAGLLAQPLFDNPVAIVCRLGHPLSGATRVQQLQQAAWLVTADRRHDYVQALFEAHALGAPRVVLQCDTTFSLLMALRCSDVLAPVPHALAEHAQAHGLVRLPLLAPLHGPRSVLIRRSGLPLTPAAECFADLLLRSSQYPPQGRA